MAKRLHATYSFTVEKFWLATPLRHGPATIVTVLRI